MGYKLHIINNESAPALTSLELKTAIAEQLKRFDFSDLAVSLTDLTDDYLFELEKIDGVVEAVAGTLNYPFGLGGNKGYGIEVHLDSSVMPLVTVDDDDVYLSATINTDLWIERIFGESASDLQAMYDAFSELPDQERKYDLETISDFIETLEWHDCGSDNTYNRECDLDGTIDYVIANPQQVEWYYSEKSVIFLRRHHGGDVRGNYGSVEVFRIDSEESAMAFIQPVVEWSFTDVIDSEGNAVPDSESWRYDEQYRAGYSSNPTYQLQKDLKSFERINETSVRVTLKDGTKATAHASAAGVY